MRELKEFNEAINYIENNLDSNIDENEIYRLTTYSYAVFGRIFSILSGISLGEYIRLRRLSKAAIDLKEEQLSVTEIAFKYGYGSVDGFSYAFKKYHGTTPLEVKTGADFSVFPPLRFSLSVKGGEMFNIKIQEKNSFKLAGYCKKIAPDLMSMSIWNELVEKLKEKDIKSYSTGQLYGSFFQRKNERDFYYMVGYEIINEKDIENFGLDIINVPKTKYTVVELNGKVPNNIHQAWEYLVGVFFPQEGYKHSGEPDFEVYSSENIEDPNFNMKLWVPIEVRK